jgi:hypothetical protein
MRDEALKLALEALENSVDLVREDAYEAEKLYGNYPTRQGKVAGLKVLADDHEKAITAIKQAIAAPYVAMPLVEFAQNDQGGCLMCGFTPKLAAKTIRARGTYEKND